MTAGWIALKLGPNIHFGQMIKSDFHGFQMTNAHKNDNSV